MEFHRSFYCDLVVIEWFFRGGKSTIIFNGTSLKRGGRDDAWIMENSYFHQRIYCVDKKAGIFFRMKHQY